MNGRVRRSPRPRATGLRPGGPVLLVDEVADATELTALEDDAARTGTVLVVLPRLLVDSDPEPYRPGSNPGEGDNQGPCLIQPAGVQAADSEVGSVLPPGAQWR